jgi:hypothetical protein
LQEVVNVIVVTVVIEEDIEETAVIEVIEVTEDIVEEVTTTIEELTIDQKDASIVANKDILQRIAQNVGYLLIQPVNQDNSTAIGMTDKAIEVEVAEITEGVMTEEEVVEIVTAKEMRAEVIAAEVIEKENKRKEVHLHLLEAEVVDCCLKHQHQK